MARRPLTIDDRKTRVRMLAFAGTIIIIVAIVIAVIVVVFGSFLARFGEA